MEALLELPVVPQAGLAVWVEVVLPVAVGPGGGVDPRRQLGRFRQVLCDGC